MKTLASGGHKQLIVVGPQWCQSTICLQQMRHNGAREPIYRHDSVFWGIETFYRSKFSPATGVKICVRSRNTQPHLKPNKVAKGIFQPKLQKRWPQLCRVLRRSLFTTKFVQFSRIIVVIRCWIFSWMTLTCNVSKILRDESRFRTCSWTCSVPGTMNIIKIIWTPWLWPRELKKSEIFCFSKWRYERQGALETDLPNCCVSITCQSLSMLWRSAREHCNSADGARHAHKFYFSVRISYKFPISDCTGDSYLVCADLDTLLIECCSAVDGSVFNRPMAAILSRSEHCTAALF